MKPQILMIITSNAEMGSSDRQTGFWAEEVAVPYYELVDAGAEVILASPKGGAVPVDPSSVKPTGENDAIVERHLADKELQARLSATKKTGDIVDMPVDAFDAIFFPGGHGTMWDLPTDAGVTALVETAFANNKFVASVCHGAAGLVTAKRADGESVVKDLRVSAFTDEEEKAVGLEAVVPFMLETRLRELGCQFEGAANWVPFAVRDGNLITGQNPQSSDLVAQSLLDALGIAKH
jgi:putative intracellular protease/amidase